MIIIENEKYIKNQNGVTYDRSILCKRSDDTCLLFQWQSNSIVFGDIVEIQVEEAIRLIYDWYDKKQISIDAANYALKALDQAIHDA